MLSLLLHLLLSEYFSTFTATMGTEDDDEVFLSCSDEEVYKETGAKKGELVRGWRPKKAEDVVRLSEAVLSSPDGIIPLSWQCPGKRPCTPNEDEEYETDDEDAGGKSASGASAAGADANQAESDSADKDAAAAAMDFDFDADDDAIKPGAGTPTRIALHPGQQRELKGSARKKTTDFNSILSNMRRHKQMDAAKAKAAAAAASSGTAAAAPGTSASTAPATTAPK